MSHRLGIEPCFSIEELPQKLESGFVIFDPAQEFERNNEQGLQFFAEWSFQICKQTEAAKYPRLFACDEIQLLMGNDYIFPEIQAISQTGRRMGLDMAIVSQQVNELHNVFRAQTTERVFFQHLDPYVLSVAEKWGFDAEEISRLALGEFVYGNDRGEFRRGSLFNVKQRLPENSKAVVDSSAQPDDSNSGKASETARGVVGSTAPGG